jgi:hypothetical protein
MGNNNLKDRNRSNHRDSNLVIEVKNHSRRGFISMASASVVAARLPAKRTNAKLYFVCSPANDLFKITGLPGHAFETTQQAINAADSGTGVLILAEQYPTSATPFDQEMIDMAAKKNLRLYVEYPAWLPEMDISFEKAGAWDRAVITSSRFGARLKPSHIVSVNDCHYVSVSMPNPDIVLARVAGFDTAVYGLEKTEVHPILFENSTHSLLVATMKLSHFRTARYGPSTAWTTIWEEILEWLSRGKVVEPLRWKPVVRPSYGRIQALPSRAEDESFRRGVKWFLNSRIHIDKSWQRQIDSAKVPPDSIAPAPEYDWPIGNGSCGMLEGFSSRIDFQDNQPVRWARRADCMGEASLTFALSYATSSEKRCDDISKNLIKFIYGSSSLAGGLRAQQTSPSFGLLNWDVDSKGLYYLA